MILYSNNEFLQSVQSTSQEELPSLAKESVQFLMRDHLPFDSLGGLHKLPLYNERGDQRAKELCR